MLRCCVLLCCCVLLRVVALLCVIGLVLLVLCWDAFPLRCDIVRVCWLVWVFVYSCADIACFVCVCVCCILLSVNVCYCLLICCRVLCG